MTHHPRLALLALATACAFGSVQAQEKVLREGQVTQEALIDALAPAAAASAAEDGSAGGVRTRSFRPSPTRPTSRPAPRARWTCWPRR
jgi:OmpA-OmpF porin, OOP family